MTHSTPGVALGPDVLRFSQVDVFTAVPYRGNPVAVIDGADHLSTEQMQRIANWTNLSETTFLLRPTDPAADYRVRIFTPGVELPFAGHPTIGSCHAWMSVEDNTPKDPDFIVQECGVGLVKLRVESDRLAFAAPPLIKGGPVSEQELAPVLTLLGIERAKVIDAQWADNGPGWLAVRLATATEVLELAPDFEAVDSYDIGVVGPYPIGVLGSHDADNPAIEVRAFFRAGGTPGEDPVTGSLNAALAQWLLSQDDPIVAPSYVAAQGTVMGRSGRVFIDQVGDTIWVGGDAVTCISGTIRP